MPPLIHVRRVVQHDKTLHDGANQEAYAGKIYLPPNGGEPA